LPPARAIARRFSFDIAAKPRLLFVVAIEYFNELLMFNYYFTDLHTYGDEPQGFYYIKGVYNSDFYTYCCATINEYLYNKKYA
jgi:hypothetical protein